MSKNRILNVALAAAAAGTALALSSVLSLTGAAAGPACDPDNGGLKLPEGFCALVVADNIGAARHLAVAANGDLYVSTRNGRGGHGGVVALHDNDGDGKMDSRETFGRDGATGVALHNGYVYMATTNSIIRYKLGAGDLAPDSPAEVIVEGLTDRRQHADKGIAFDGKGGVYVNVGAPSNACQLPDRQPKVAGQDPCQLLEVAGGIWRFDENTLHQKQTDGKRYATGLRQMPGITWYDNSLWAVMHNRDGLDTLWPGQFTAQENADLPAEYLVKVSDGANFGWPYCFYSTREGHFVTNPEYGGDGKKTDRCGAFTPPVVAFPAHWAPNDVAFYTGTQFPQHYRGGAFVAFHGSWNRAPLPMAGYNITFVPFTAGKPGTREVFADGFAGKTPLMSPSEAVARPGGLAVGPDGSLYITEDVKGKVWRVMYTGK